MPLLQNVGENNELLISLMLEEDSPRRTLQRLIAGEDTEHQIFLICCTELGLPLSSHSSTKHRQLLHLVLEGAEILDEKELRVEVYVFVT